MLPLVYYTKQSNSSGRSYDLRGYKQRPPYNLITPYFALRATAQGSLGADSFNAQAGIHALYPKIERSVQNAVYDRLVNQLGDSASFGATLTAEFKQTLGLVTGTVIRLAMAARSIKKLDFKSAALHLGLPYKERTITLRASRPTEGDRRRRRSTYRRRVFTLPTGREVQKTLANGWLMYSYGVKPLAQDCYSAMNTLQSPLPGKLIRASAMEKFDLFQTYPSFNPTSFQVLKGTVRGRAQVYITVVNPNLYLANKLGLTNPLQWALEAVPFSFVIDWFSNLSSVVNSLTNFQGLATENSCRSMSYELSNRIWFSSGHGNGSASGSVYTRDTGLPSPSLLFAYERPNVQRALNAISLLVGFLPKK